MLKNISIRGARRSSTVGGLLLLAAVAGMLSACERSGTGTDKTDYSNKTQIVVQWVDGPRELSAWQVFRLQGVFDDRAEQGGFISDGNDVGSGTQNFYLYADDERADAAVRYVIAMRQKGELPEGMRIGVAVYKDAARKDWSYRVAYPDTLKHFDITYREKN